MPVPFHANIDFSDFADDGLNEAVGETISRLTTNVADYPSPPVPLSNLATQIGAFNTIRTAPIYDSQAADLKAARDVVETSVRSNGVYVNTVANGNVSLLEKSGYPISRAHVTVGQLAQTVLKATAVIGGSTPGFDIDITPVDHALGYLVIYLPVASIGPSITSINQWNWAFFSKHTGQIMGLASNTRYRLISIALGTDPNLNLSNPVDRSTD